MTDKWVQTFLLMKLSHMSTHIGFMKRLMMIKLKGLGDKRGYLLVKFKTVTTDTITFDVLAFMGTFLDSILLKSYSYVTDLTEHTSNRPHRIMKKLLLILPLAVLLICNSGPVQAQNNADKKLKKHINKIVQKVKNEQNPVEKREILNEAFDDLTKAFEKVENMENLSDTDQEGIANLRKMVNEKQNELNGKAGFTRVPDSQLNNFANYVQQDFEQADEITISVTVLLLIIIILLLL